MEVLLGALLMTCNRLHDKLNVHLYIVIKQQWCAFSFYISVHFKRDNPPKGALIFDRRQRLTQVETVDKVASVLTRLKPLTRLLQY